MILLNMLVGYIIISVCLLLYMFLGAEINHKELCMILALELHVSTQLYIIN
jgi:hypothetical protein